MVLPVTAWGDNPQQPSIVADVYVPDQLIAGNLKLVTDSALIYGSAKFPRGTLMGLGTFQGSAPQTSTGKARASGTVTILPALAPGATVTINGTVITFVAADPAGNQVLLGAPGDLAAALPGQVQTFTANQVATNLAALILGSTDANLKLLTASVSGGAVTLLANAFGTAGNAYTLATSDAVNAAISGANFTGGTANAGTATIGSVTMGPNTQKGLYTVVLTAATTGTLFDPMGNQMGATSGVVMATPFSNSEIGFTITTGGSPAAGDTFGIYMDPTGTAYTICLPTATDGSSVPAAVLADDVDCTGGQVVGGVYLMGQFNATAMTFGAGINAAVAKAALQPRGIFLKTPLTALDPL